MAVVVPGDNPLLVLATVLVAGVAFGSLAKRVRLPSVTGQILVGVLLGPSFLPHFGLEAPFSWDAIHALSPIIDFALGLMAVAVGSHLHFRRLGNARRRLAWLLLLEASLTPLLVYGLVSTAPSMTWRVALLLSTIAVSTAPATILALVKEGRAKGVFVKTLVAAVALNNLACICLFEMAHAAARQSLTAQTTDLGPVLLAPLRTILSSAVLGGGVGVLLVLATRRMVRPDRLAAASLIAILLTAGLAGQVGASTLLSCMFLGVLLANLTPDKEEIGHEVFDNFEYAIFAVFFTLAGMELRFEYLAPGGLVAGLMFAGRLGGKLGAGYLAMKIGGATRRIRRLLGAALLPQAGLAVGLMLLVIEDPAFEGVAEARDLFLAVILTVVLLNEIVGPIATRWALTRSGDYGKDRARLIDFLQEEHILTNLQAGTKEEAIRHLAAHLHRTQAVQADRQAFLDAVLAREREASTCLGEGLAVPHAPLEAGDGIVGVMGISGDGLRFDTPDGQPVHCMVLLGTPAGERGRHLEVLAALARSIGKDRTIRQQLYHAKSPAHAYEILHADEESEDFNYFLDDDAEDEEGDAA